MVNDVRREKAKRMLVLAYRKTVYSAYMRRVKREERLRLQRYNNFSEYANYFAFLVIYIWLGISAYVPRVGQEKTTRADARAVWLDLFLGLGITPF